LLLLIAIIGSIRGCEKAPAAAVKEGLLEYAAREGNTDSEGFIIIDRDTTKFEKPTFTLFVAGDAEDLHGGEYQLTAILLIPRIAKDTQEETTPANTNNNTGGIKFYLRVSGLKAMPEGLFFIKPTNNFRDQQVLTTTLQGAKRGRLVMMVRAEQVRMTKIEQVRKEVREISSAEDEMLRALGLVSGMESTSDTPKKDAPSPNPPAAPVPPAPPTAPAPATAAKAAATPPTPATSMDNLKAEIGGLRGDMAKNSKAITKGLDDVAKAVKSAVAGQKQPQIVVNVPHQPAPQVRVEPKIDVHVPPAPPPHVTVQAPPPMPAPKIEVNVPPQPAPQVTVQTPPSTVHNHGDFAILGGGIKK